MKTPKPRKRGGRVRKGRARTPASPPARWRLWAVLGASALAVAIAVFTAVRLFPSEPPPPEDFTVELLTTGYCNCGICCSWTTNFAGEAVYDYGRMKGRPKEVGRTATGTTARKGTVAADPRRFPFGTRLHVPGYGMGRVEDVGGAIKGDHLDLWFPTHEEARQWGRRVLPVRVFPRR